MKESRKNKLGDFFMSIVMGCATIGGFIVLCLIMWGVVKLFETYLKSENI
jgi:hypothetical protein